MIDRELPETSAGTRAFKMAILCCCYRSLSLHQDSPVGGTNLAGARAVLTGSYPLGAARAPRNWAGAISGTQTYTPNLLSASTQLCIRGACSGYRAGLCAGCVLAPPNPSLAHKLH